MEPIINFLINVQKENFEEKKNGVNKISNVLKNIENTCNSSALKTNMSELKNILLTYSGTLDALLNKAEKINYANETEAREMLEKIKQSNETEKKELKSRLDNIILKIDENKSSELIMKKIEEVLLLYKTSAKEDTDYKNNLKNMLSAISNMVSQSN